MPAPASLLAALVLVRLADEWFTFLPFGALEPLHVELNLSYAEVGLIFTALGSGVVGQLFTVAADFVDRRRLATAGAFVVGLSLLAFGLGSSLLVLIAAALVWGAADDAFIFGTEVALVNLVGDDLPGVLGRVNAYGSVGDLLGPLTLAGLAVLGLGWRPAFLLAAALMLLYAGWLSRLRFPSTRPESDSDDVAAAVLGTLRDKRVVLLAVASGLFDLLDEPFQGFTIAFLQQVRGVDPALATLIVGVDVVANGIGYLSVATLSRRVPARALLLGTSALLGVSIGALLWVPLLPVQLLAAAVFGFSGAAFHAVLEATYLRLRPGQAGTSQAVVSTLSLLGAGFPALVGAVADADGLATGYALYAAVPVAIVLLLLVAQRTHRGRHGFQSPTLRPSE